MTARIIYLVGFTITGPIFIPLCLSVCLPTRQARIIFLTLAISVCLSLSLSLFMSFYYSSAKKSTVVFVLPTHRLIFRDKKYQKNLAWFELGSSEYTASTLTTKPRPFSIVFLIPTLASWPIKFILSNSSSSSSAHSSTSFLLDKYRKWFRFAVTGVAFCSNKRCSNGAAVVRSKGIWTKSSNQKCSK